jgi:hypothetical protein
MSEQQKVAITKKQHLDTAGQMWVDYHMNAPTPAHASPWHD